MEKDIENLSKKFIVLSSCSDDFKYHMEKGLTIDKNIFRPGSKSFLKLFKELRELVNNKQYEPNSYEKYYLKTDIGETADFNGNIVPLDLPFEEDDDSEIDINNAEFKGKEVALNKPKRGGSKKFYVYVKDGDRVKKVSFGDPGMSLKISDPKARASFKARHKCETKKDKTTAGYWSCRIGRYPHLTGAKQRYTWW